VKGKNSQKWRNIQKGEIKMIKRKGLMMVVMSFALMFSGVGFLSAQGGPGMGRRGPGPGMGPGPMGGVHRIVRGLDLTEDQRAQIRAILKENKDQIEQTRSNIEQARKNLDANYPETADALGAAHAEAALLRAQIHEQIKQILTPEQLNQLEERRQLREERREQFPGRFGRGGEL
jgi:Spy/CpxP family protein refolding chaperone